MSVSKGAVKNNLIIFNMIDRGEFSGKGGEGARGFVPGALEKPLNNFFLFFFFFILLTAQN